MLFSTRAEYGLRFLVLLAKETDKRSIPVREIAEREYIPRAYLEKLAVSLRNSGFVQAMKGPEGGYSLAKNPSEIFIGKVISALEGGPIKPFLCPEVDARAHCALVPRCQTKKVWEKIDESVNQAINGMTLADIIN